MPDDQRARDQGRAPTAHDATHAFDEFMGAFEAFKRHQ